MLRRGSHREGLCSPEALVDEELVGVWKRIAVLLLVLSIVWPGWARAQASPSYSSYKTRPWNGKRVPVKIRTGFDKSFRTRLHYAGNLAPNFAGHWVLTAWGCGTECLMGAVVDLETGHVVDFPFSVCCWGQAVDDKHQAIDFRKDSRLIPFRAVRNEIGALARWHYEFTGRPFD